MPCLRRPDLFVVLHAGRALRRPLQATTHRLSRAVAARCCRRLLAANAWRRALESGLAHYLLLMVARGAAAGRAAGRLSVPDLGLRTRGRRGLDDRAAAARQGYGQRLPGAAARAGGMVAWWLVLAHTQPAGGTGRNQRRQTQALQEQAAGAGGTRWNRTAAPTHSCSRPPLAAESANQAKSRYITTISHELRTPLNSASSAMPSCWRTTRQMPEHRRDAVRVIRRGGDHLLSLIEGTLDIARIERRPADARALLPIALRRRGSTRLARHLFELQAAARGLGFRARTPCDAADAGARPTRSGCGRS